MKIIIIFICLLSSPLLGAQALSQDVEKLSFGQQEWTFKVEGVEEVYDLKARVYPPTKVQVNFWDSKEIPDNLTIFPTINGNGVLEKALARYFSRRGFWVVLPIIPELENPFDEMTAMRLDVMFQRIQQSSQVLHNNLQQLNPKGRNFLLGGSQGGIRSIIAAQVLKDVDAVWVNAAGGDFPSIYANSSVDQISSFRRGHMEYLNLKDPRRYEDYLRANLLFDPITNCDQIESRLSFVIALEDSSVPTANQLKLLESCKPEKVKRLEAGHLRGVIDTIFNKRKIRNFFERTRN